MPSRIVVPRYINDAAMTWRPSANEYTPRFFQLAGTGPPSILTTGFAKARMNQPFTGFRRNSRDTVPFIESS